jgi:hypothetical protein
MTHKEAKKWERDWWALEWHADSDLDGCEKWLMVMNRWKEDGSRRITLFETRKEAREYRDAQYGYIKDRPDLKAQPHAWKLPSVVRVRMTVERVDG